MADLNTLYKDYGIRGIIPYANQRNNAGYLYLLGRLKAEDSFFVIRSIDTSVPFLRIQSRNVEVLAYSSREAAQMSVERLSVDGYHVEPAVCSGEAFLDKLSDIGVDGLRFDDTAYVYLSDLVTPAADGFQGVDVPLRNSVLNAALYLAYQEFASGHPWEDLFMAFFHILKDGHVLIPVLLGGDGAEGIKLEDSYAPLLQKEDSERFICVFTDNQSFVEFWESSENMREIFSRKLTYVASYEELLNIMKSNGDCSAAFNPGTTNLFVSPKLIDAAENALSLDESAFSGGTLAGDDDPTPDFLR